MAELELFYIATSKIKEIRSGGEVTFTWGNTGSWKKFKEPSTSSKTIKWKSSYKSGLVSKSITNWAAGGVTKYKTSIPSTATRTIDGVDRTCDVRYRMQKYAKYTRTKKQKSQGKCTKKTFTYHSYQLQYKDKPVVNAEYSTYVDDKELIFFGDHYFDNSGARVNTNGHLPHPTDFQITYSDVHRNFESSANNSDSRDNKGSFVLANVRANVVTLTLTWTGLSANDGKELLDTLNPSKDSKGNYPYLLVQYRDPATNKAKTGTFYASERNATKYPNGYFREITVTLTEV